MISVTQVFIILAKFTAFWESRRVTSWGVVTIIAAVKPGISWATLKGSSPVPGGELTIQKLRPYQSTSGRN